MTNLYFTGQIYRDALNIYYDELKEKKEHLNKINLYPVPDGDTGNNMFSTVESAYDALSNTASQRLDDVSKAIFNGARSGSTGNSGAILSEYFRGLSETFDGFEYADIPLFTKALRCGYESSYNSLMHPKEGTILTVAREVAEKSESSNQTTIDALIQELFFEAKKALLRTKDILSVLKNKDAYDAGAWGLYLFFSALAKAIGLDVNDDIDIDLEKNYFLYDDSFDFDNPYDMEFKISGEKKLEPIIRSSLSSLGDELITRGSSSGIYVHIHTSNPIKVVEEVYKNSKIDNIIIRDMQSQYLDQSQDEVKSKGFHVLAFGSSPGLIALYAMSGADAAMDKELTNKKKNIINEYINSKTLILSSESINFEISKPIYLMNEIKILSVLVSMYADDLPSEEEIKRLSGYTNYAKLNHSSGICHLIINDKLIDQAKVADKNSILDLAMLAIEKLNPKKGDSITIYYGYEISKDDIDILLNKIDIKYPYIENKYTLFSASDSPIIITID